MDEALIFLIKLSEKVSCMWPFSLLCDGQELLSSSAQQRFGFGDNVFNSEAELRHAGAAGS